MKLELKLNNYYRVVYSRLEEHCSNISPQGTIVRCSEDRGDGFYIIKLEDNCGKKISKKCTGWLTHLTHSGDKFEKLNIKEIRKLKMNKINEGI